MKQHQQIVSPLLTWTLIGIVLFAFGAMCPAAAGTKELTYVDLVKRLTDLEHLATLPQPGEQCAQWSSWDRRSQYDATSDQYINWAANGDGGGIIRQEGDERVFAEIEGPGVIWRIWSARANEGHVKIYLDGADAPAVDLPFIGYFNLENEPFTYPALVHETARGQNCYVPIPFQKSCKITAEGDWGMYYHFTYTTYPKETVLPTFTRELSERERRALDRANTVLTECSRGPLVRRRDHQRVEKQVTVPPGKTVTVFQLDGTHAITGMEVKPEIPETSDRLEILRELALHLYWDGESRPSVWTPLGDFFGTAPGVNKYKSLPLGMADRGFYSNWYMPFENGAVIKLTNDGDTARTVRFSISHAPLTKPIDTFGRFHAKWHRDTFLPKDPERRKIDWTMLKTEGRGRFCGVMLHVWNPRGGWWGEGDEKFFVDGEKFPSTFGTGSEDYFGYAWCDPELFQNCFHNQTISMKNRGHISVNRWHITDNVPFQTSFEAAIEKYYANDRPTLYAAIAYWYQAAGQSDPYQAVPVTERKGYWHPIERFKVKGAIEFEQLPVLTKTAGNARPQDMSGFGPRWSNESHLWWTGAKPGDTLDIALPVEKTGAHRLKMQFTKAVDYGIVQLYLNGKKLGEPIDLYNTGVIVSGVMDFGIHELTRGGHILKVEILGANEKAVKGYMVGLDYFKLEDVASSMAEHLVPAEKDLSQDFIRSLTERGERAVYTGEDLETIGMPVSGIATGQMYLRGDGTLASWQIFNKRINTGSGRNCYRTYRPDSPVDSGFALVLESGGQPVVKKLDKDFGTVRFSGEYPIGLVRYNANDCPIVVEMEAFSPFIPLNAKDSALPATVFHITLKNTSNAAQNVGLLSWLENAVCLDSAMTSNDLRRSRIVERKGRTSVVHTAKEAPKERVQAPPRPTIVLADFEGIDYGQWKVTGEAFGKAPVHGTLPGQSTVRGFTGKGLVNTYLNRDKPQGVLTSPPFEVSRKFVNFLIGGGDYAGRTCINLIADDKVIRTAVGNKKEELAWSFWNIEELKGKTVRIEIVDRHSTAWGHINVDQIELADKPRTGLMKPLKELPDYGSIALTSATQTISQAKISAMLSAIGTPWAKNLCVDPDVKRPMMQIRPMAFATESVKLAPQEKRTFTFVLSWFMPNHAKGHEYTNRFDSATDVAHYVLDNHDRLTRQTRKWHQTFYEDSTLPRWLLFRLHSTVSNLATGTCQWWKNGRFWAWEGVGCCAGTCTHVWNYAHAPARLFPELERSVRKMQDFGEGFDPESGLVGFRSNRAYAADGQNGTIVKAYREHLCSANDWFLRQNWPRIKKALEYSIGRDENEDGLIEDSQHNTFDINFEGPNTFVGSLYLAALRAGEEMAKEMDDEAFAQRCRRIFESGQRLTLERLWDGEYFNQITDVVKYDWQYGKGCLSDQLFGQGWADQLGLGYLYPPENVTSALQAIWKYNWAPDIGPYNVAYVPGRWFARAGEGGLFTCTWPKSAYLPKGVRYKNEVWTGIEYQVAGHMAAENMVTEALAICRAIEERYHPAKHNPFNEVECGDHYARAMASWSVFTSLCGFEYQGPSGHMGFAPQMTPRDFKAAFTAAEGWGLFTQTRTRRVQRDRIALRWGKLSLKTLSFAVPKRWTSAKATVTLDGKPIDGEQKLSDGSLEITLDKRLSLSAGQNLQIEIRR